MANLAALVALSNRYGADGDYVLAGGGNTSYKEEGVLYVKASGTRLADIGEAGFVKMDMAALLAMLEKQYPAGDAEREAAALEDMMAARLPGQENMRPSVECILHALFPQRYVVHLHPALVNGLTCSRAGEAVAAELFGDDAVWMGLTKPGYVLGKACHDAFARRTAATGKAPRMLLMQNHGAVVAGDTPEETGALLDQLMAALQARVRRAPDMDELEAPEAAETLLPALRMLYMAQMGTAAGVFCANREVLACAAAAAQEATGSTTPPATKPATTAAGSVSTQPPATPPAAIGSSGTLALPFTPDQIVYCKGSPLVLAAGQDPAAPFADFVKQHGYAPKIVLAEGVGLMALGKTPKEAAIAREVYLDAVKIAVYAESFGGPLPLTREFTDFILNWEVENYRQQVSLAGGAQKRMQGKLCVVTGAAQGFGEGIARAIAAQGGSVVIADMNEAGAAALADELNQTHGPGTALALRVNVADEASVRALVRGTVLAYGGLDLFVSCAGILIAGGLPDMTKENFEKVTAVNYTGYMLCAKYASAPMKVQRKTAPAYMADIIEINSKSGLEGSKANFAYAGSKFGGVGLTQSFALELAEYGIKVNAVCPGNLLDGPLWSDPEHGLFRQYLDAGKVPGAGTIEDVRRFYEAKVPLGRGCTTEDVAKAVFYLVEQQYETGQALPVTGGQVMLN